jgi:membrane protease YdiL (CAAX protease family)
MDTSKSIHRSLTVFFVLVFALSAPFWLLGALTRLQLMPGLPISSLSAFAPLTAALILVYRENKSTGISELVKRAFDYKRIKDRIWYLPIILFMPGVMLLEYSLMRWMGTPVPPLNIAWQEPLVLFALFFMAALGEELGWMGYLIDPMQVRVNALQAAILQGMVWSAWHLVVLGQAHQPLEYIAWQSLCYLAERVLFVWLYNNTGKSVFAVLVFHTMLNVSWQLFPINGSFYDPRLNFLIFTLAAVIVTVIWGPKTLAQSRFRPPQ